MMSSLRKKISWSCGASLIRKRLRRKPPGMDGWNWNEFLRSWSEEWGTVASVAQDVRWRITQPIATPFISECRPRIGVPREILEINDVAVFFAGGG
jgi:hypothetical protein